MPSVEQRLAVMGIVLPAAASPVATYVSFKADESVVHISGQLSTAAGDSIKGMVGDDVSLDRGIEAARICAVNLMSQMRVAASGDLDRVEVMRLGVFVQAGAGFWEIPTIANGCSDLIVAAFGARGAHARSAVGVYRLPFNFAVEVDATVRLL
jgi:enamine deaminase RidA (YjgF/YER057c/UK114 family)